jgi:hypothetical protein
LDLRHCTDQNSTAFARCFEGIGNPPRRDVVVLPSELAAYIPHDELDTCNRNYAGPDAKVGNGPPRVRWTFETLYRLIQGLLLLVNRFRLEGFGSLLDDIFGPPRSREGIHPLS